MYTFCRNFIDEQEDGGEELKDYFYTLLIIQTGKEEVFGAFISAFPFNGIKDQFVGTVESFVFRMQPGDFQRWEGSGANHHFMLCQNDGLTIGAGGDGPAISLDQELFRGSTSACASFGSPMLVPGTKHIDDEFKAKNIEVFLL